MKKGNRSKKLTLNKKTIADLSNGFMDNARGGIIEPSFSACDPDCTLNLSACKGSCNTCVTGLPSAPGPCCPDC